jgi:hypothetical protein
LTRENTPPIFPLHAASPFVSTPSAPPHAMTVIAQLAIGCSLALGILLACG